MFCTTDCDVAIVCWQRGCVFAAGGRGTTGQLSADRRDFFFVQSSVLKSVYRQLLSVILAVVYWHGGKNLIYKGFLAQALKTQF